MNFLHDAGRFDLAMASFNKPLKKSCHVPVNKVKTGTQSEQDGGLMTKGTTSPEQRHLGKHRVRLPCCTRLTNQYNGLTEQQCLMVQLSFSLS